MCARLELPRSRPFLADLLSFLRALPRGRLGREICSRSVRALRLGLAYRSETRTVRVNGGFSLRIATWVFLRGGALFRTSRDAGKASRRFRHSYRTHGQGCAESFRVSSCLGRHVVVCEEAVLGFERALEPTYLRAALLPRGIKSYLVDPLKLNSAAVEYLRFPASTSLSATGRGASALRGETFITATSLATRYIYTHTHTHTTSCESG